MLSNVVVLIFLSRLSFGGPHVLLNTNDLGYKKNIIGYITTITNKTFQTQFYSCDMSCLVCK